MLDGGNRLNSYPNITVEHIYRQRIGKLGRLAFKLAEHIPGADESYWYNDWRENVTLFDTVIIFDGIRSPKLIRFIKRRNPNARIIIYYVNTFTENARNSPNRYRRLTSEFYTFDKAAATTFGIRFKPFFYEYEHEAMQALAKKLPVTCDALFFGSDKGRLSKLLKIKNYLDRAGLTTKISVYADKKRHYGTEEKKYLFSGWASYSVVAEETAKTRAVIDITQSGQTGITLRPLESIFMHKKLITDNADIINYDFYTPNNVFLLGRDDIAALPEFITTPYVPIDEAVLNNYRQETWLEGFFYDES